MPFFGLPNLISKTVSECTPWAFQGSVPDEVRGKQGKKARDAWINSPDTQHLCYSAFEGLIANARIREGKGAEEENPPFRMHAFVADIDCPVTDAELQAGLARTKFAPNFFERTLSGNARLIWLLEIPVTFPNRRFAIEFLELAQTRMRVDQIAPGLDVPAWREPNRYYTSSCDFYSVDESTRIGRALIDGWVLEVAEKHKWRKQKNAIAIPLPIVYAALQKKHPNLEWGSDFVEESQGPSFWLPASTSPKSAIVKPTGLFTFSSSAQKPFYTWSDLLGPEFVETYETELLGEAVKDIYHDGKAYYRHDGYGDWKAFAKEDIVSHLTITRGLEAARVPGESSEVGRAMEYLKDWQAVVGAAPFVFQPTGLITKNGNKFLNTHTRRPLAPAPASVDGTRLQWSGDSGFPFLYRLLDGIFDPHEQLDYFISWLSRFYRGAYEQNLESGQNVFILGSPGVGKTFLSQGVLPALMGGSADAEDYLLGKTQFNSDLFEVGLWTVDDNSATVDAATHRKFTAMAKKMAANTSFAYHAKFRIPCSVDWLGRVVVTANDDEESARIVPDLSQSNLDKLSLMRTARKAPVIFPPRRELLRILREELPYLARFLLDYEIPEHCKSTSRFGVASYHEQSLMRTAEQSSRSAGFLEIVEDWQQTYFGENAGVEEWVGTAFQFLKMLNKDSIGSAAGIRNLSADSVGRSLATLHAKGMPYHPVEGETTRQWRILRPKPRGVVELPIAASMGVGK